MAPSQALQGEARSSEVAGYQERSRLGGEDKPGMMTRRGKVRMYKAGRRQYRFRDARRDTRRREYVKQSEAMRREAGRAIPG